MYSKVPNHDRPANGRQPARRVAMPAARWLALVADLGAVLPTRMKTHIIHIIVATLLMVLCAVVAAFFPPLWQGVSGRDFRPQAAMMGILMLMLAATLRAWRRWPVVEFLGAVVCAELLTLCVIAHFSGFTWLEIFNSFNLSWLATMSVFIAAPWLAGLLVGSLLLRLRQRADDQAA